MASGIGRELTRAIEVVTDRYSPGEPGTRVVGREGDVLALAVARELNKRVPGKFGNLFFDPKAKTVPPFLYGATPEAFRETIGQLTPKGARTSSCFCLGDLQRVSPARRLRRFEPAVPKLKNLIKIL